MEQLFNRVI